MATVEVTITGDLANVVDQDFTQAQVRLRANTDFIADRDADKIRVLGNDFTDVAVDGSFSFSNVIASTDTIVAGTLQYYVDIRCRQARDWVELVLGPYVLTGNADLSDLEATQPTALTRALPEDEIDEDVLGESQAYTDDQIDLHVAASNPHAQYARMVDGSGTAVGGRIIRVAAGGQFPTVVPGAILIYGGN